MAEKLINKAGLEEFAAKIKEDVPLIGSTGSGTVPEGIIKTSDIQDGAVTMNKIDFTGLKNISGFPIATYNMQNAGSDTELDLIRVGNLVIASGTFVTQGTGAYDEVDINNIIPSG